MSAADRKKIAEQLYGSGWAMSRIAEVLHTRIDDELGTLSAELRQVNPT
jgi:hypothetical protein